MHALGLFSDFQLFQFAYQAFGDCPECTGYNCYYHHPYVPQLGLFACKVQVLISLFVFCDFHSVLHRDGKVYDTESFRSSFSLIITWSGILARIMWSVCISNFVCFILSSGFSFVRVSLSSMIKFQFLVQFPVDHLPIPVVYYHHYQINLTW